MREHHREWENIATQQSYGIANKTNTSPGANKATKTSGKQHGTMVDIVVDKKLRALHLDWEAEGKNTESQFSSNNATYYIKATCHSSASVHGGFIQITTFHS